MHIYRKIMIFILGMALTFLIPHASVAQTHGGAAKGASRHHGRISGKKSMHAPNRGFKHGSKAFDKGMKRGHGDHSFAPRYDNKSFGYYDRGKGQYGSHQFRDTYQVPYNYGNRFAQPPGKSFGKFSGDFDRRNKGFDKRGFDRFDHPDFTRKFNKDFDKRGFDRFDKHDFNRKFDGKSFDHGKRFDRRVDRSYTYNSEFPLRRPRGTYGPDSEFPLLRSGRKFDRKFDGKFDRKFDGKFDRKFDRHFSDFPRNRFDHPYGYSRDFPSYRFDDSYGRYPDKSPHRDFFSVPFRPGQRYID
jgi:hypothetical protein